MSNDKYISLLCTVLREISIRNMGLNEQEYYNLLNGIGWIPASFEIIANSLMETGVTEMYHALVHQDDINLLFTIPNLEIFWGCRCHIEGEDGSTTHEHFHALVRYKKGKHTSYKRKMKRAKKQGFHSKTTFKKVLCADHAVGVLRYITCKDGQTKNKKRDINGLVTQAHTHYCRKVYVPAMLHKRNARKEGGCSSIRREIQERIWEKLSDTWLEKNVSGDGEYALHHDENCVCENGKIGKGKKVAANEKRKAYFETEEGKTKKRKKADDDRKNHKILRDMKSLKKSGKKPTKEEIIRLINMM